MTSVTRPEIDRTASLIGPRIRRTPVIEVSGHDLGIPSAALIIKLEHLQHAGSFKTRGAVANLLLRDIPHTGVAAASGGNHGTAVAYAAQQLGVSARIFVPTVCSSAKIDRIRSYGAALVVGGDRYGDALDACQEWVAQAGALSIHAFDQRETLLGQGTVAAELAQQDQALDTVLVAVGGGGLIGGIAAWYQNAVRIIGVEPTEAPTLTKALEAGRPVDAPTGSIAADSLAPRRVGELVFPIAQAYVQRVVQVTDDDLRAAQQMYWNVLRIVVEPGAAAPLAALLSQRYVPAHDERVGLIVSGANTVVSWG